MAALPIGRAQRAYSGMPEIISIQALLVVTDSSFRMAGTPDGRVQRAHSGMPEISAIRALIFAKIFIILDYGHFRW